MSASENEALVEEEDCWRMPGCYQHIEAHVELAPAKAKVRILHVFLGHGPGKHHLVQGVRVFWPPVEKHNAIGSSGRAALDQPKFVWLLRESPAKLRHLCLIPEDVPRHAIEHTQAATVAPKSIPKCC